MKIRTVITISALVALLQVAPVAFSQPPAGGAPGKNSKQNNFLSTLSPEEREKFKKARLQAWQDPNVQAAREKMMQANKEFRQILEAALLKADPSIKPVLDKMPKPEGPPPHED